MTKYDYIKCPYCDNTVELKDCPDFWSNEEHPDYKKQEKILKKMQKCGFNIVTCGICGGIVLEEKEKTILEEIQILIEKSLNPDEKLERSYSLDCFCEVVKMMVKEKGNNLMTKNCINCEKETILKYSDIQIELDKAKKYIAILEQANDIAQQLNQALREENEQLRTKLNNSIEME